jgi:esterase/lipase superfamily enzyme
VTDVAREKPTRRSRIKEIVLAAPDIDGDVFKRDIAPALAEIGKPITLYASEDDRALIASREVHGAGRAGDAGRWLVIAPGIETLHAHP